MTEFSRSEVVELGMKQNLLQELRFQVFQGAATTREHSQVRADIRECPQISAETSKKSMHPETPKTSDIKIGSSLPDTPPASMIERIASQGEI